MKPSELLGKIRNIFVATCTSVPVTLTSIPSFLNKRNKSLAHVNLGGARVKQHVPWCSCFDLYYVLTICFHPYLIFRSAHAVAEAAVGLGGLQPPLDPKTPWSPPSFWRRKDEEEGEEEERKEEISPPFKNFWIRHCLRLLVLRLAMRCFITRFVQNQLRAGLLSVLSYSCIWLVRLSVSD